MSLRRFGFICGTVMLCMALFTILTGCVGYVGPDGGAAYVGPEVDVGIWGGGYGPHDAHAYSHRGYESRHGRR